MAFIVFEIEDLTGAYQNMCGLFHDEETAKEWILNEGEGRIVYSPHNLGEIIGYRHFGDWYKIEEVQFLKPIKENITCTACSGMGWLSPNAPLRECPKCEGSGYYQ